ncbi:unnamed protein product [Fusarium graminearum]|nr:unnamed protein product [Fusarium graminearum]CAG1986453.1 unnamed protein product [Fusarium graminearum]CAG1987204.1 unnamed protein product [Fusarium graminearum]
MTSLQNEPMSTKKSTTGRGTICFHLSTFSYKLPLLNNWQVIQDTCLLMVGAHPNTDTSRTNSGGSQLVSKDRQIHRINANSFPRPQKATRSTETDLIWLSFVRSKLV